MRKPLIIMILTGIFLIGFIVRTPVSQGVEWKYFTMDSYGNPMYYDAETVERTDFDVVNVWIKYEAPSMFKMKDYGFSVSRFKIDCFKEKLANEIIVDFDKGGFLLSSVSSSGKPWFSISPDSMYAKLSVTVCPPPSRR
jgi:hypothetical protein